MVLLANLRALRSPQRWRHRFPGPAALSGESQTLASLATVRCELERLERHSFTFHLFLSHSHFLVLNMYDSRYDIREYTFGQDTADRKSVV